MTPKQVEVIGAMQKALEFAFAKLNVAQQLLSDVPEAAYAMADAAAWCADALSQSKDCFESQK